jgi:predicted HTH transcriptional regulator
MIEIFDFEEDGLHFSIIAIEPSYDRPVRFGGIEYIRIGDVKRKLSDLTEHMRALWMATGRRRFEEAVALPHQTMDQVLNSLDYETYYTLSKIPKPKSELEIIERLQRVGAIRNDMEGGYDITNLGAILFAKSVGDFSSISSKSVRLIRYTGKDKSDSDYEQEGVRGYAVGFEGLVDAIGKRVPYRESFDKGIRRRVPVYPEIAVREIIANALIHQDFTADGVAPTIELYEDRIEVSNPGGSLVEADRLLDERRSRNAKLASLMRDLGLCEERGGGLDKALAALEAVELPAPEFIVSETGMRVVLFGPRPFSSLSKKERMRAAYFHCVLRWLTHDYMSNATLRKRFGLRDEEYQAVSGIISESVKTGRIVPADVNQGRRNARYIPYFAG